MSLRCTIAVGLQIACIIASFFGLLSSTLRNLQFTSISTNDFFIITIVTLKHCYNAAVWWNMAKYGAIFRRTKRSHVVFTRQFVSQALIGFASSSNGTIIVTCATAAGSSWPVSVLAHRLPVNYLAFFPLFFFFYTTSVVRRHNPGRCQAVGKLQRRWRAS